MTEKTNNQRTGNTTAQAALRVDRFLLGICCSHRAFLRRVCFSPEFLGEQLLLCVMLLPLTSPT